MKQNRILVAGGAGFIGSHLCQTLLNKGHFIICLDNLVTGDKKNIQTLLDNPKFQFIKGDTRTFSFDEEVDEIYDLASPASVTYVSEHPVEAATSNSIGTKNLLDLAHVKGAAFLFASSSEAYGDPKVHPQPETYWGNVNPVGIRSGYDEGKRFGEALTMAYVREKKVKGKIVRIFNTYGPHSSHNDSRVIPRFVAKALKNDPIPVHGDGTQTRSFCYVSDMVEGLVAMMESQENGPINLGNPEEYRIVDVAKKIIEMTGSSSTLSYGPRPSDDPARRMPDITLAKKKLNWEPSISLEVGLHRTIEYFRS